MQAHGALGDRRLLLVEDDVELRTSLSELLGSDGYDVIERVEWIGSARLPRQVARARPHPARPDDAGERRLAVSDRAEARSGHLLDPGAGHVGRRYAQGGRHRRRGSTSRSHSSTRRCSRPFAASSRARGSPISTGWLRSARLAAGIAHEINNPLTYVIANLQLLEEEMPRLERDPGVGVVRRQSPHVSQASIAERAWRRLRDALEGAERIRGIVLHVKTFSRAETNIARYVDVRSVLDSSIKVVFSEIRAAGPAGERLRHMSAGHGQPGQLGQVFLNLLLNAAHAIDEDDPQNNTIRVIDPTTPSGEIVVEISDTGPRHSGRGSPSHLRSVLHDQAARSRHRAWPFDLPRHRQRAPGNHQRGKRARVGDHVPHYAAGANRSTSRLITDHRCRGKRCRGTSRSGPQA